MIASLHGPIISKTPDNVVVNAGGVGYLVNITLHTFYDLPEVGESLNLMVYTHMWKEGMALFGFSTLPEKEMFLRLISISGIGPKLARNILSGIRAGQLAEALREGDLKRIRAVPGIGKKIAERIMVELRAKGAELPLDQDDGSGITHPLARQVVSALVNLGYKEEQAAKVVTAILIKDPSANDLESLLRTALQTLAK